MSGGVPPEQEEIERAILRYLIANPDAKDTLEGITEWWLLREWTARKIAAVQRAVQDLQSKGLLVEVLIGQQAPSYRLNREKLPEIRKQLSERESQ